MHLETSIVDVDFGSRHQRMDGFGFCQAFQRADIMHGARGLPEASRREVLDLLFSRDRGAGLSILRLGIGSSVDSVYDHMRSIAPSEPGGSRAPLRYEWDGQDSGQVWLAREAMRYGVRRFYACAWSAPGYMLSNGSDTGGGVLRGLPGASADGEDWRAAYAEYLLQYVRFYRDEGIEITDLGFVNEPDIYRFHQITYAGMRMDSAQVVDFVKVIGPAIARSGLPLSLVCCDAMSWVCQGDYTKAIEADPEAARWVSVHAGHGYLEPARTPLPTGRNTWMSEWEPDVEGNTWIPDWDSGDRADGIRLAENVHDTLTAASVNGYLYWMGASIGGTRALIQLDGPRYTVSKRLWALAAFSRFVRPGAFRVAASASDPSVKVSAFAHENGDTVVNLLNLATRPTSVTHRHAVTASYVTDEERSLAPAPVVDGDAVHLAPRSLTTLTGSLPPATSATPR
jgi:glucuronoarabinoxylan endo-1,4-beta-xylanase